MNVQHNQTLSLITPQLRETHFFFLLSVVPLSAILFGSFIINLTILFKYYFIICKSLKF